MTLLAACAPAAPSTPPAPTSGARPATAPAQAATPAPSSPRAGGTLRIGLPSDVTTLEGHFISPANFDTVWAAYDRLTEYDNRLQPQPRLAESWDVSSDGKQVKLVLRKGVQFHSGRELTSEDIRYNLLRVRDPKIGVAQLANMSNWFTEIETPDKHTIILKSEQPRPAVFDLFEYMNIVDRETMEGPEAKTKIVGTGPFTFVERVPGVSLRFAKNKSYWESGRPYLDELEVKITGDPQASITQLEGGALDVVLNPAVREAVRLRQDSRYRITVSEVSGQYHLLGINTTVPPLDNKKVRQAINYAIDRKRFADSLLLGTVEPRALPWPKHSPAYDSAKEKAYAFDLDRAKALLGEAGVSDLDLEVIYTAANTEGAGLAQILQADLAKIGVKLTLRPLEPLVWRDQTDNVKYRGLNISSSGFAGLEPVSLFSMSRHWSPQFNSAGFKSERYVQLINAAAGEPDVGRRKQIYAQMNDFLLDESFVLALAPNPPIAAARVQVGGVRHTIHEAVAWRDVFLSA